MNPNIERFNRTVKDQFVNRYAHDASDIETFNHSLMDYLFWYNTEKPHRGLNKAPPLRYYVDIFTDLAESNMSWTPTLY